ncbi:MAG: 6-hydroxymethylpterin diphosphokinase MptE-like protein [Pseudomonadota bacterium]
MHPYPFLKENVKALEKEGAPVFHWLAGRGMSRKALEGRIIRNRRGFPDWRMSGGRGLFDALTPAAAYRDWIPGDKAESSATLIVGTNLGYGLHHVLTHTPDSHQVMVLEPRPEMLLACLSLSDYRPFLKKKRLSFIPPDRALLYANIRRFILPCLFGKVFLRSDLISRQLGAEYAVWTGYGQEALEYLGVELNTVRLSQDRMIQNELGNFERAMGEGGLTGLKGRGRGISAVILGAGPSLDALAPQLGENPGHALYAAAFQILPALEACGLKPHFCMAVDVSRSLMRVYDRLNPEWAADIPLIYATTVDPEVVRAYPGPTFPLWTLGGLASHVLKDRDLVLDVGGNVGVGLFRLMLWLGVDRILLAGQDFAWPGSKTHASGHFVSEEDFRFDPKVHIRCENREGETLYSALPYMTALRMLEGDIARSGTPVCNLYGGGMDVEGSRRVTLEGLSEAGLLESVPGSVESLFRSLELAPPQDLRPLKGALHSGWMGALRRVRNRMERLFRKNRRAESEIRSALNHALALLQQDPLFRPYLTNEILNLAGLMYGKKKCGIRELGDSRQILKRVFEKVREMERGLRPLLLEN